MRVIAALVAACAATICARPLSSRDAQAADSAFQITNLDLSDNANGNFTISFKAYDPEPLANVTATCTGTWKHGHVPTGTYELCGKSTFAWRFTKFTSIKNFTIGLEDKFSDPAVGDPPYDVVSNFANAVVNSTLLTCNGINKRTECKQDKGKIIYAPVYATVAKR